jgi:hypothetical protein
MVCRYGDRHRRRTRGGASLTAYQFRQRDHLFCLPYDLPCRGHPVAWIDPALPGLARTAPRSAPNEAEYLDANQMHGGQ